MAWGLASRSSVARSRWITWGNTARRLSLTRSSTWLSCGAKVASIQPVWVWSVLCSRSVRRRHMDMGSICSTPTSMRVWLNCSMAATSYGGR